MSNPSSASESRKQKECGFVFQQINYGEILLWMFSDICIFVYEFGFIGCCKRICSNGLFVIVLLFCARQWNKDKCLERLTLDLVIFADLWKV